MKPLRRVAGSGDFTGDGKNDVPATGPSGLNPYQADAIGDQCWRNTNATIVWNGHSTELVRDDTSGARPEPRRIREVST